MTATTQTQTLLVVGPHYKWLVLSNTTVGVLLATLNSTSLLSALPVAFGRQRSTRPAVRG